MGFNPNQQAPAPPPSGGGGGRKRRPPKTPRQVAERGVKIAQAREQITHAEFNRQWSMYNDIYQAYAGRNATYGEAKSLINSGLSTTSLAKYLATKPAFYKSPIWQQNADKYLGPARNMGMKVRRQFVAKAIANNWDPYVFQEKLRQRPEYLQSNEFKTTTAGLTLSYRKLYGTPSPEWEDMIKRAALGRWTPDQWEAKLRADPAYKQSSEYQDKLYNFKSLLGF